MHKRIKEQNRRVCILTTVHFTFDTRIFYKEAKTLVSAGYDVTLIAQHTHDESVDGVQILALPTSKNRIDRMTRVMLKAVLLAFKQKAAVYHFHDPELLPAGLFLKLCRKHVIYDAHEHVAKDILGKPWIHPRWRPVISAIFGFSEAIAANFFDVVIAATAPIARNFPPEKSILVQNFAMSDELLHPEQVPYQQRGPLIAYVGVISEPRGLREMVSAMSLVSAEAGARLQLVGKIDPPNLEIEMRGLPGWVNVDWLGFYNRKEVAKFLNRVRVGIVLFHPLPNYDDSQPNKLFEYMSAGIPVIASNFPIWREFIEETGCGLVVNPLNIEEIACAIEWVLSHPVEAEEMGKRGQQAIQSTYNWNVQAAGLLAAYEKVVS